MAQAAARSSSFSAVLHVVVLQGGQAPGTLRPIFIPLLEDLPLRVLEIIREAFLELVS